MKTLNIKNNADKIEDVEIIDLACSDRKEILVKANKSLQAQGLETSDDQLAARGFVEHGMITGVITFDLVRK